jgi:pyruvate/2-oxoglutarate dehydrogenase complex dihydrolipoamide dehydrogenase (E3) component
MKNFDLIIIGGGAGVFAAAICANELKAKTALV